jgi:hypothetical protein
MTPPRPLHHTTMADSQRLSSDFEDFEEREKEQIAKIAIIKEEIAQELAALDACEPHAQYMQRRRSEWQRRNEEVPNSVVASIEYTGSTHPSAVRPISSPSLHC